MKNCADREGSFWALIRLFRSAIAHEMLCCFVELAVPPKQLRVSTLQSSRDAN